MSTTPPTEPSDTPSIDATAERLRALQASRGTSRGANTTAVAPAVASPPARTAVAKKPTGPKPARIVAAAASVSAGIGLVALMAGAQQDIVVQVNPTPVTVQPASIVVEMSPASIEGNPAVLADVEVRAVEPAAPAEQPAPQARVVTQSEGS